MNNQTKPLVPKLRFPEFLNAPEWKAKRLEDFAVIVRGGSPRPIDEYLTNEVNGLNWLKIGDIDKESKYVTYTQEKVISAALSKTRVVNPDDLILSNSMSFGRPYILKIKTCIHDGWIAVSKIDKSLDRDYLYYLMMTSVSQLYFSNNAAGSGVQNLNADIIKILPVSFPDKKEQQKIADCLSSIDELISVQTQKLDTLKTHKKGLMQQLFPAEGETVPQLRFPEFRDGGEWELKSLGNYIEQYIEKTSAITDLPVFSSTREGLKPQKEYYDGQELINEGEYGVVPHGYFVYRHMSDDNIFKFNINNLSESIAVSKEYPVFKARKINADFLLQKLNHDHEFKRFAISQKKGGTRTRLYFSTLSIWQCLLPLAQEQKKIADCLASVDEMIAAQVQKVEALKQHKKGLMQQLFPAAEEVAG